MYLQVIRINIIIIIIITLIACPFSHIRKMVCKHCITHVLYTNAPSLHSLFPEASIEDYSQLSGDLCRIVFSFLIAWHTFNQ